MEGPDRQNVRWINKADEDGYPIRLPSSCRTVLDSSQNPRKCHCVFRLKSWSWIVFALARTVLFRSATGRNVMETVRTISSLSVAFAISFVAILPGAAEPLVTIQNRPEIREARRLDVGIRIFDPGIPLGGESRSELAKKGTFPYVRRAEARYMAFQLKQTLERSGLWGAVRVVPDDHIDHLTVSGAIRSSTGRKLKLKIRAVDARGKTFLKKTYTGRIGEGGYGNAGDGRDPFQPLYNEIANDLLKKRDKKSDRKIGRIRDLRDMRFAASLLPEVFSSYIDVDRKGRFELERLPARDDPMMVRIERLHVRDRMFIDTLQAYYETLAEEIREPYDAWRAESYARERRAKKIRAGSRAKQILGVAVIIGGVVGTVALDGHESDPGRRPFLLAASSVAGKLFESADQGLQRARGHESRLRELGESLDSDFAPTVMWLDGETLRFEGTMESQYAEWKTLLKELYLTFVLEDVTALS